MSLKNAVPKSIQKKSAHEMTIAWSDGNNSVLRFDELRFQCRCAECVDEWTRKRIIKREQVDPNVHPRVVEPVGRYAIQIEWSDGHRAGIYPYELLYKIAAGEGDKDI